MAEHGFQEVMRQWRRMCDAYTTEDSITCCKGCRMDGRGCGAIYESDGVDFGTIEYEIMAWAAENPEPVFPTWGEYLHALHNKPSSRELSESIPYHIAQKLGLKPKEGDN